MLVMQLVISVINQYALLLQLTPKKKMKMMMEKEKIVMKNKKKRIVMKDKKEKKKTTRMKKKKKIMRTKNRKKERKNMILIHQKKQKGKQERTEKRTLTLARILPSFKNFSSSKDHLRESLVNQSLMPTSKNRLWSGTKTSKRWNGGEKMEVTSIQYSLE